MSNQPPIEVPQGAIRLNTDSQRLEFFAQDRWYEFATEEGTGLAGRAFRSAGEQGPAGTVIETFNITTTGNSHDTGFDLSQSTNEMGASGSRTRAILAGGYTGGGSGQTYIQYFEMTALANSIDFGDLTVQMGRNTAHSNNSRCIITGSVSNVNDVINFITVASTGNAQDFGDCITNRETPAACGNRTRAIWGGGTGPSPYASRSDIDLVTIASTGDATDFGDLTLARYSPAALSNGVRGVWGAGVPGSPYAPLNIIDFATISSTGNAQDFGDLQVATQNPLTVSNATRGIFAGGGAPSRSSLISFITISTRGDATAFGELENVSGGYGGNCNSHGGVI